MVFQERPRGDMRCSKCDVKIESDHPYSWCSKCGTPLPKDVQSQLARLQAVEASAKEAAAAPPETAFSGKTPERTRELVVEGRAVPCPVCGHDRFWTRRTVLSGRGLAIFNLEWAGSEAENYVCDRCGHVLWFIRR